jgi:hypothetical protein
MQPASKKQSIRALAKVIFFIDISCLFFIGVFYLLLIIVINYELYMLLFVARARAKSKCLLT